MLKDILDFCFPNYTCLVCGRELNAPKNPYFCDKCAEEFFVNTEPLSIRNTKATQHFKTAHSAFVYAGDITNLILRFKYNSEADIAEAVAPYMAAVAIKHKINADIIVPVPLSAKRFRTRGYNQALFLATELGKYLSLPAVDNVLTRIKTTEAQKHMTVAERTKNLDGAFEISKQSPDMTGKRVLLVDDVFTSGSTANECAKVLRAAGVTRVDVLTIAAAVL